MDALKNTVNSTDEDIIDLTEIIEQGVPQPSTATRAADTSLDAQMDDLFNGSAPGATVPDGVESDIDALLSEMDGEIPAFPAASTSAGFGGVSAPARASDSSGRAGEGRIVDPDEQLEMPGMAEVDSLLKDMDIPPQPDVQKPAQTPPPAEDLDALLTDLLDSADVGGLSSARAVSTPGVEPMEKKVAPAEQDDLIDNLDALFQQNASKVASAVAPAAKGAAPVEKAPSVSSGDDLLDDLDALMGTAAETGATSSVSPMTKGAASAPVAATPVAPTPAAAPGTSDAADNDLLDDLDALMGTAAETGAASSVSPLIKGAASAPVAATPVAPTPAAAPGTSDAADNSLLDDLDALMGTSPAASPPAAAPHASTLPVPDISEMEDLDMLLGNVTPKASPAAPPVPSMPAGAAAHDVDSDILADLDAILDGTLPPPDAVAPSAAQSADGAGTAGAPDHVVTPPADTASGGLAPSSLAPPASSFDVQAPPASENSVAPELPSETWRAPLPGAGAEISVDGMMSMRSEDTPSAQELGRAAQELLDEKVMLDARVSNVDTAAWMHHLDDALDEQQTVPPTREVSPNAVPAAPSASATSAAAVSLEELFKDGSPACAVFAHIVRSAVAAELHPDATASSAAPAVSSVPPASDVAADLDALTARLAQLEEQHAADAAVQKELRERLATLDTHHQERLAALEARLGSLHAEEQAALAGRLKALEARMAPLEAAVEAMPAASSAESSLAAEDVSQLEQGQVALEDRLAMLEGRLHQSEKAWAHKVEQAAAAAAAKIIREEIAALLAE